LLSKYTFIRCQPDGRSNVHLVPAYDRVVGKARHINVINTAYTIGRVDCGIGQVLSVCPDYGFLSSKTVMEISPIASRMRNTDSGMAPLPFQGVAESFPIQCIRAQLVVG
jgi:hypothetical protein